MGAGMTMAKHRLMLNEPHLLTAQSDSILTLDTDMRAPLKALRVGFEPVQDLHGYDEPWPGGGGKNKLDQSAYTSLDNQTTFSNGKFTSSYAYPITDTMVRMFLNGSVVKTVRSNATVGTRASLNITVDSTWDSMFIGYRTNGTYNVGAYFAKPSVDDGTYAVSFYVDSVTTGNSAFSNIQFEAGSATAWSPYSNICPISGWTGANVEARGKNLWDGTFVNMAIATFTAGVKVIANSSYRGFYVRAVGGNSYTISRTIIETNRFRIGATVEEPARDLPAIWLAQLTTQDSEYSVTVTLPEGYNYIFVYLSNRSDTCTANNYQVELGSTATAYEPYQGSTVPISWTSEAGTVYGGYLEWLRDGTVRVTKTHESVDMGELTWVNNGTDSVFANVQLKKVGSKNVFCDKLVYSTADKIARVPYNGFRTYESSNGIAVKISGINRYNARDTLNGMMLVYELATPITYTLTPQEAMRTLRGENNLWSDANGPISATYWTH